tara:strand:- start:428 stop:2242 length:1815 start_codon:yes stop_codon:yes gene_type:complete
MLEIYNTLKQSISDALEEAFATETFEGGISLAASDPQIVPASKPEFGDFQVNVAFSIAKKIKQPPQQVAQRLIQHLKENKNFTSLCETPQIAGPGFININIKKTTLLKAIQFRLKDSRLGVPIVNKEDIPEKRSQVIVDFSSPNIAKEMHVGHLRSTIIGDCIARVMEFRGYNVLRLNHVGDWGTQFGMLITHLKAVAPEALTTPNAIDLGDLVSFYREAKKNFDEDKLFQEQSRQEVVKLQASEPNSINAWKLLCDQSRKEFEKIYNRLDIEITERGESFYNCYLENIIQELDKAGLLITDDGAKCVFLKEKKGKDGKAFPVIVQKSDQAFNYSTTDLAAIKYRFNMPPEGDGAFRLIYVTDAGQANHFESIFEIAERAKWIPKGARVEHVPFGLVQGEDGKKLKTRSGETVKLSLLLDRAIDQAESDLRRRLIEENRVEEESFIKNVSTTVGLAAVKYADLSQNRISNYQFSFEKMLSLQGNTAPYLLYALVRIAGISRKGIKLEQSIPNELDFDQPQELRLIRELLRFDSVILEVEEELLPNRLCNYLFELSQTFNRFYDQVPILKAANPQRNCRLSLCKITADTLKLGLHLLGINSLERM